MLEAEGRSAGHSCALVHLGLISLGHVHFIRVQQVVHRLVHHVVGERPGCLGIALDDHFRLVASNFVLYLIEHELARDACHLFVFLCQEPDQVSHLLFVLLKHMEVSYNSAVPVILFLGQCNLVDSSKLGK